MDLQFNVKTEKNFENALESLKESLGEYDFGVLWELNFKDKLEEKGLVFGNNFNVMEVCDPKQAKKALDRNIKSGYFLPCKIVVYEDNNSVHMGLLSPQGLFDTLGDDKLSTLAEDVESKLKKAIEDAR